MTWDVVAFYRFVSLADLPALRHEIRDFCMARGIVGTTLLAPEGINGTMAGQRDAIPALVDLLDRLVGLRQGEVKYSTATAQPFQRTKIRLKREIITLGAPEADPAQRTGTYVDPQDWNALIAAPDVVVVDTRNVYETATGMFAGAIDPQIQKFSDFKTFVAQKLDPTKHRRVAVYCTGGIRDEKASSYLLAHGFREVYQLRGGILKYLETVPADHSTWRGDCFVFDQRGGLGHGLSEAGQGDRC